MPMFVDIDSQLVLPLTKRNVPSKHPVAASMRQRILRQITRTFIPMWEAPQEKAPQDVVRMWEDREALLKMP